MNNVELWKSINREIIKAIEEENEEKIEFLVDEREEILKSVNIEEFKNELGKDIKLDLEVQKLLQQKVDELKKEVQKYKTTKNANSIYVRNVNKKINLFNQKI